MEKKKKIVDVVSPTGGLYGGVENVLKKWSKNIDQSEFELRFFHCHGGMRYLDGYENSYCIDRPFKEANLNDLIEAYASFVVQYGAPDICIANNWPMMVKACHIVRNQLQLSQMKLISWIHSGIFVYEKEGLGDAYDVALADAHFAISKGIAEEIKQADSDATIYDIGNPIDFPKYNDIQKSPYLISYVGRLSEEKHVELILKALSETAGPWILRIVGDGDRRNEVQEWIRMYHLEKRVQFVGWSENPWEEVQDSPICVLASEYEGFALVAFEASARGKTVISTPVNGVVDYIEDGKNGYIYPFNDATALAAILDQLETGEKKICDSRNCIESVGKYETRNYFETVTECLHSVCES